MMGDVGDRADLGIDTTPRRPGGPRPSAVPSSALLAASRAFWGLAGSSALGLAWWLLAGEPGCPAPVAGPAPATTATATAEERRDDRVAERYRRDREAGLERDRLRAEEEEAAREERVGRLGPKLFDLPPDRRLWLEATPEAMALVWARRARPGSYRVLTARKLYAVLIATLEEDGTGQTYGLRAGLNPGDSEAKLRLTEMHDP